MTKKDYERIARAIVSARATLSAHNHPLTASDAIHAVVTAIADECKNENIRFDRDRFWNACHK